MMLPSLTRGVHRIGGDNERRGDRAAACALYVALCVVCNCGRTVLCGPVDGGHAEWVLEGSTKSGGVNKQEEEESGEGEPAD